MALVKIKDFNPNYREYFDNTDIIGFDVYSGQDKVGSVADILLEENGTLRYLVINTGMWLVGKKVLLPIGKSKFANNSKQVQVDGLTKIQVENLPNYSDTEVIDGKYEENVRNVYRDTKGTSTTPVPVGTSASKNLKDQEYDIKSQDSALYDLNDNDHPNLRLYEERLIADKTRQKTGDVIVGKKVETEKATVSVPLAKERVIVERTNSTDPNIAVNPDAGAFQEGEIARMEVYEESADIRKEAYVREEVNVKKIIETETATGEEQLRRERVEVTSEGKPIIRDSETSKK